MLLSQAVSYPAAAPSIRSVSLMKTNYLKVICPHFYDDSSQYPSSCLPQDKQFSVFKYEKTK